MESTPEQAAEGMAVVRVLSAVLDRLVGANVSLARADPGQVTKFHALKAPGIGILQYLERIHKYASCSNECFILALIYIDRLIQRNNFLLTELNVHRVVITAVLLAAKFFDDAYYNNAYYAKVGGVLVSEMNGLEVEFLFRINFSLHVSPEVFHKYHAELVAHAVGAGLEQPKPQPQKPIELPPSPHRSPHELAPPANSGVQAGILLQSQQQQQLLHPHVAVPVVTAPVLDHRPPAPQQITPSPPQHAGASVTGVVTAGSGSAIMGAVMTHHDHQIPLLQRHNSFPVTGPFGSQQQQQQFVTQEAPVDPQTKAFDGRSQHHPMMPSDAVTAAVFEQQQKVAAESGSGYHHPQFAAGQYHHQHNPAVEVTSGMMHHHHHHHEPHDVAASDAVIGVGGCRPSHGRRYSDLASYMHNTAAVPIGGANLAAHHPAHAPPVVTQHYVHATSPGNLRQ